MGLTYLLTGVVVAAVMAGMAVGVMISNRRVRGSCGGLARMTDSQGNTLCDGCTNPSPACDDSAALEEDRKAPTSRDGPDGNHAAL